MTSHFQSRYRQAVPRCFAAAVLLIFTLPTLAHARAGDADLQKEYGGKTLTLRQFLPGDRLHFDASGRPSTSIAPGPWTLYGQVRVESISLKGSVVHIGAQRSTLFFDGETKQMRDLLTLTKEDKAAGHFDMKKVDKWVKQKIHIEIECAASQPEMADVIKAMNAVFLAPDEPLSNVVPDFWKAWLQVPKTEPKTEPEKKVATPEPGTHDTFRTSGNLTPLQHLHSHENPNPAPEQQDGVYRVGRGVKAPHATYTPDPEYSEQARQLRYQGTCVLQLIVGPDGSPRDIRITHPVGLGLDEQAVRVVRLWRFDPATKDGTPVPVQINTEMSFHLY